MILYKNTQYGKLLIIILSICGLIPIVLFFIKIDDKPMQHWLILVVTSIFIITLLLFYKLTITISKEKIEAEFGIGLIKRTLNIKDINYDTIEEIKTPSYYGIGIRITPNGLLYNVKTGNAIKIKSNEKTFFIGTDDFEKINSILIDLKK
ncbi:hypothetical protein [Lacinutrix sp.]|uniref:hypothetical protein n=1 Tax=Lacinutrix sp. TaxID=1937692 RepID=UPI0025B84898|nr:hypothetical protein [Lacinutrix sp.]